MEMFAPFDRTSEPGLMMTIPMLLSPLQPARPSIVTGFVVPPRIFPAILDDDTDLGSRAIESSSPFDSRAPTPWTSSKPSMPTPKNFPPVGCLLIGFNNQVTIHRNDARPYADGNVATGFGTALPLPDKVRSASENQMIRSVPGIGSSF